MNRSGKLHALLATARIANVPSVVSNVGVGFMVGLLHDTSSDLFDHMHGLGFICLPMAGVCLYISGNFFNDWMDRGWDQSHRPERALPQGLFAPSLYAVIAVVLASAGLGLAWMINQTSGWVAATIVFWIVIYTLLHKRTAWAVIPMGLCRALLPIMGSVAVYPYVNDIWPAACALLFYITGLSLTARHESMAEPPMTISILSRGLLLGTALLAAWGNHKLLAYQFPTVVGALPYLLWTSLCLRLWRKPVPKLVSRLLAGIPLVDWMTLLPLALILAFHGVNDVVLMFFIVPPVAFVAALFLQKVAPAT